MNYLVICRDIDNSSGLRTEHLQAHLSYIETIMDCIQVAGPIVEEASGEYRSSCFIYQTTSKDHALKLLHNDPYYRAGIYQSVSINEFKAVAGGWVGGKSW